MDAEHLPQTSVDLGYMGEARPLILHALYQAGGANFAQAIKLNEVGSSSLVLKRPYQYGESQLASTYLGVPSRPWHTAGHFEIALRLQKVLCLIEWNTS